MQIIPLNAADSCRHLALSGTAPAAHRVPDARDTKRTAARRVHPKSGAAHAEVPGGEARAGAVAENIARSCAEITAGDSEQKARVTRPDAGGH